MSNPVAPHSPSDAGFELSSAQARLWRWQAGANGELAAEGAAELELELPADVDEIGLRASLANVCARHEVLRTHYQRLPDLTLPLQVIAPEARIAWNTRELGAAHLSVTSTRSTA